MWRFVGLLFTICAVFACEGGNKANDPNDITQNGCLVGQYCSRSFSAETCKDLAGAMSKKSGNDFIMKFNSSAANQTCDFEHLEGNFVLAQWSCSAPSQASSTCMEAGGSQQACSCDSATCTWTCP